MSAIRPSTSRSATLPSTCRPRPVFGAYWHELPQPRDIAAGNGFGHRRGEPRSLEQHGHCIRVMPCAGGYLDDPARTVTGVDVHRAVVLQRVKQLGFGMALSVGQHTNDKELWPATE